MFLLFLRDHHFGDSHRRTGASCPLVTVGLQVIQVIHGHAVTGAAVQVVNGLGDHLLAEGFVGVAKFLRNEFVEDDTTDGRLDNIVFLKGKELDLFTGLHGNFDVAVVVGRFAQADGILFEGAHVDLLAGLKLQVNDSVQIDNTVFVSAHGFGRVEEVGQDFKATEAVLLLICSRPLRTSC